MKVPLSKLSYNDYQCLLQFVKQLLEVDFKNYLMRGEAVAVSSEIIKIQNQVIRIMNNWSLNDRHKKLKSTSITYMQAYILFQNYDMDRHPIQLNERVMYLHKYLIHIAANYGL